MSSEEESKNVASSPSPVPIDNEKTKIEIKYEDDDDDGFNFGREPINDVICSNCHRKAMETIIDREPGFASYLTFMGLFVVGMWPLLWLPFTNYSKLPDTFVNHTYIYIYIF